MRKYIKYYGSVFIISNIFLVMATLFVFWGIPDISSWNGFDRIVYLAVYVFFNAIAINLAVLVQPEGD